MKSWILAASAAVLALGLAPARADDEPETTDGWDGDIGLSASSATGNSETMHIGFSANAKKIAGRYTHLLEGKYDYAEQDGDASQNALLAGYQLDIQLRDRTYSYGRVQYDRAEFSGIDNRFFVGAGLGHYFVERDDMTWRLEGGPGYRYTQYIEPEPVPADFDDTESEFALYGNSIFEWEIRDGVDFTHTLDVTWTDPNTSINTEVALVTKLTDSLSSKLSYEIRHETDPIDDKESTDTLLKASILYGF